MALWTVFFVVLIDLLGFGIVLPLLPFYATQFNASPVTIGLLYGVYSLSQLIFSPLWGSWSDRIGRRPIMMVSTFGAAVSYLIFAFSHTLGLLFLSRTLAGVMGGNISAAQAYVADVTSHEDRARGMGMIGAAFGIGFTLGPALASLLIHPGLYQALSRAGWAEAALWQENRYAVPGFFACLLSAISFALVVFKLPESHPPSSREDPERIRRNSLFSGAFWRALFGTSSKTLSFLFLCSVILAIGQSSLYSAFPLFCKKALLLPAEDVGLLFGWMGLVAVFIQGGLIRILVKKFGEKKLFLTGNIVMAAGLALIPWAGNKIQLTEALCLLGVGGSLNGPTLVSLISKSAPPRDVGANLGNAQGLSALGRVIGPTWGGWLFGMSAKTPFLLTALLVSVTIYVGFKIQDGT